MIPYLLFIIVVLLTYRMKKPIWMAIAITVFAVIRFDTGWDYDSYYQACIDPNRLEIAQMAWGGLWGWWFEYVYQSHIPFIGIGIPAVLTTISVYIAFKLLYEKDNNGLSDAMLVYSLWPFLYLFSFCTVRQSLAMGIMMLAFVLVYRKQYKYAIPLYLLNYFIHPSSAFSALFLLFVLPPKRLSSAYILIGSVVMVIAFGFLATILERLGMLRYMNLLESSDSFGGKISYVYAAMALYYIYFVSVNKDVGSIYSKMSSLATIGCVLQFLVYVTDVPSVISRACSYTYMFLAPTIFYSIKQLHLKFGKPMAIGIIVAFFLVYLYVTQNSPGAVSQYVPYKTIFSQL